VVKASEIHDNVTGELYSAPLKVGRVLRQIEKGLK